MEFFHAANLSLADGSVLRFGPDEEADGGVPSALETATQIPGGYAAASITLPRPPSLVADDASLFSSMEFYSPYGTFYEGRVIGAPQVGVNSVRIDLEGWSAALDDDETFRCIFIDRTLNRWQAPGLGRQDGIYAAGYAQDATAEVVYGATGAVALDLMLQGQLHRTHNEVVYDAGPGMIVARVVASSIGLRGMAVDGNLFAWPRGWDNVDGAGEISGSDYRAASSLDFSPNKRVAVLNWYWETLGNPAGVAGDDRGEWGFRYSDLFVLGDHGLPLQGSAPGGQGFSAADILGYVLGRAAPDLTFLIGDSIETGGALVTQLAILDPVAPRSVVETITGLGGAAEVPNDWGVYNDRTFFWRTPGSYGRTWRTRSDDTATSTSEGPQSSARCTGYFITYQDGAGHPHSVGPPGSGAELESSDLAETSPQNPASRLRRRWKQRDIGQATQAAALSAGRMLLSEANRIDWHGSVEVIAEAKDASGSTYPACMIRAGDTMVSEGDSDPVARPIASTSYSSDDMKAKCDIGAPPYRGEVLLAQLAAGADIGVQ